MVVIDLTACVCALSMDCLRAPAFHSLMDLSAAQVTMMATSGMIPTPQMAP